MKGALKGGAFCLIVAGFILLYFLFPKAAGESVSKALILCRDVVIPSLFIFFILSRLFIESSLGRAAGRVLSPVLSPALGLSGEACAVFVLSLIAGYPAGGITAVTLYKNGGVSKDECERLLMFSNNCGPAFLITATGASMLGSVRAGVFLYVVHIVSAALIAAVSGRVMPMRTNVRPSLPVSKEASPFVLISDAISESALIMLNVCATIAAFAAAIGLLSASGAISGLAALFEGICVPAAVTEAACASLLELTTGTSLICALGLCPRTALTLVSAFAGFGGFCVHMQLLPHIYEAGLRAGKYLLGKTVHGALSAAIAYTLAGRFFESAPAFAAEGGGYAPDTALCKADAPLFFISLGLMVLSLILFWRADKKSD
ncbi:MAG: hypothetical protein IKD89_03500 [Clostridia bacterium]|nr:hypothetical protein [Clostridia bacterium]